MILVEADKGGIIVTGDNKADVYAETLRITERCGEIFCSFITPVQQADGRFVSRGNVVINSERYP